MKPIKELHNNAMDLAEKAFLLKKRGEQKEALLLFKEALELEKTAAEYLPIKEESEPTRSILFRSAASLSFNAQEYDLAERLVAAGLSGFPPYEIKEELKSLYEDVNFSRHLKTKGIILNSNQMVMTLAGNAVKYGGTAAEFLMSRLEKVSTLFYRTVERMLKKPYRISGGVEKDIKEKYGLFINAFHPSSFAVSFQIGAPEQQLQLPNFEDDVSLDPEDVVDEMMECLEVFESGDPEDLRGRISDENYYGNFVGLAKELAPDGNNINLVGFSTIRNGEDKPVSLRKKRKQISEGYTSSAAENLKTNKKPRTHKGTLISANTPLKGKYGTVYLHKKDPNERLLIKVPISLMKDVVKPYYEESVIVQGYEDDEKFYLEDISLDSE